MIHLLKSIKHMRKTSGALLNMGRYMARGALYTTEQAVTKGIPALTSAYKTLNMPSSIASSAAKKIAPGIGSFMGGASKVSLGRRLAAAPLNAVAQAADPLLIGLGAYTGLKDASKPNRFAQGMSV